jgi:hypothetical protein
MYSCYQRNHPEDGHMTGQNMVVIIIQFYSPLGHTTQVRGQLYTSFLRREMPLTSGMCGACQRLTTVAHIHTDDGDKAGLCNAILNSTVMWLSEDFSATHGKLKTIWNVT